MTAQLLEDQWKKWQYLSDVKNDPRIAFFAGAAEVYYRMLDLFMADNSSEFKDFTLAMGKELEFFMAENDPAAYKRVHQKKTTKEWHGIAIRKARQ